MEKRIQIKIYGLVQGVFFRIETKKTADKLGLTGWVKNMPDGTVLITAEGPEENLTQLKQWTQKGPEYSTVEKTEIETSPATNEFKTFEIRA